MAISHFIECLNQHAESIIQWSKDWCSITDFNVEIKGVYTEITFEFISENDAARFFKHFGRIYSTIPIVFSEGRYTYARFYLDNLKLTSTSRAARNSLHWQTQYERHCRKQLEDIING